MGTCGTCKYRGPEIVKTGDEDTDWENIPTGFFQCERIKHDENWDCPKGAGAVVHDGSGYVGKLCVEADFGCIKYEPQA